jgi:hypothetical protein
MGCGPARTPVVPLYEAQPGTRLAMLTGRLEVQGPCVVVVDQSEEAWTIAWPDPGTRWDFTISPGYIALDGTTASIGDTVALGGGAVNEDGGAHPLSGWIRPPAAGCLGNPFCVASAIVSVSD